MQEDTDKIIKWTNTWLMRLNLSKCLVMHIESKIKCSSYMMRSNDKDEALSISKTELEKDLGVIISIDLKFSAQSNKAT